MDRESKGFHGESPKHYKFKQQIKVMTDEVSEAVELKSEVRASRFDGISLPDTNEPSKKAIKAQLKIAKAAVKAHIDALTGKNLNKAYRVVCGEKELDLKDKRKAVEAVISELPEKVIEDLFKQFAKTGLKDETMQGRLNAKMKKATADEIWHFIAEYPLPKVPKPRKAKTEDNGEAQEI